MRFCLPKTLNDSEMMWQGVHKAKAYHPSVSKKADF